MNAHKKDLKRRKKAYKTAVLEADETKFAVAITRHNQKAEPKFRSKRMNHERVMEHVNEKTFKLAKEYIGDFVKEPVVWKSPAYSTVRQVEHFVEHCFFKYPVPKFLTKLITEKAPYNAHYIDKEHEFFVCLAVEIGQGNSLKKIVDGALTARECHLFLNKGDDEMTPKENFWWARFQARNIPKRIACLVIDKLLLYCQYYKLSEYSKSVIDFFANNHQFFDMNSLGEVCDYIRHTFLNTKGWNLKGRTYSSIVKASNEWHEAVVKTKCKGKEKLTWVGLPIDDYVYKETKNLIEYEWRFTQIKDSYELIREGQRQRHCVSSYTGYCQQGKSGIFKMEQYSFDVFVEKHLTIEVNSQNQVVQARGKFNRPPNGQEIHVLENFCRMRNLTWRRYGVY